MQVVMVMFPATGQRRNFNVTREMTIIGRREDCDLRIPLGDISRKHCRMIREADSLRIEDLGSSNGTYVNGQRIQEAILQPGDTIRVGPVLFVLQVDGVPADDQLVPNEGAPAAPSDQTNAGMRSVPRAEDDGEFDPMSALQGDPEDLDLDLSSDLDNSGSQIHIEHNKDEA
ncbi:MAG TPA: FHA domain-containing protein [Tepidisphaeraceae bacterium]|jgi:pSer/pThr/pTyr-binding forkhead associated (FHA) protein|nr:FHA domain-containing protein [Tepidisphaeraceae bacterium]